MLNSFFQAICRVGIFMICAQAIMHFKAKESYEKYLKLLVSTMILIQLFLPVGNLLAGKGGLQAESVLEEFKKELEQEMRTAEENAAAADAILEQMTLEEIRNYVEEAAEERRQQGEITQQGDGMQERETDAENDGGRKQGENEQEQGEQEQKDNVQEQGKKENQIEVEVEVEEIEPISIGTTDSGE